MALPMSLVIRLLSLFLEGENITIYEGRLPNVLAGLPLPEKTQVAVAFVRREHEEDFLGGIALDTPLAPEAFMAQVVEAFTKNGWKRFKEPSPFAELLFKMPGETPPWPELDIGWSLFAKGDLSLTLSHPTAKPGRPTHAFIKVERVWAPPPQEIPSGRLPELLPLLTAPEGDAFSVGLTGGGKNYVSGNTTITTELAPGGLAEHFALQFEASGWRVTERLVGEQAALTVLERRDRKRSYDVQLSVFRPAGRTYSEVKVEASLRSSD